MEEPNKPKTFEERTLEHLKEVEEREKRMANIRIETRKWLEENDEIATYFKDYNPSSVSYFYDHYAHLKALYLEYGDSFGKYKQQHDLRHIETARDALQAILTKKLYDLRRQWGAELIKLPGIECSCDFQWVSENVFSIEWLNPISQEEFDCFIAFLEKTDVEYSVPDEFWRADGGANFLMEVDDGPDDDRDAWFEFHNLQTGAGKYLLLPDIRGKKDRKYLKAYRDSQKRENPPPAYKPNKEEKEWFSYSDEKIIEAFIKRFEPKENRTKYRNYISFQHESNNWDENEIGFNEQLSDSIFNNLLDVGHPLPIEPHKDWRVALYRVWLTYERNRLLETLKQVYSDYLFHIESGLPFASVETGNFENLVTEAKQSILNGRELLGEPRNFDY